MARIQPLYEDATLIVAGNNVVSGWFKVEDFDELRLISDFAGGTTTFTVEWSNDGVTADVIETVTVTVKTLKQIKVAAKFARIRISQATANLTTHKTLVHGDLGLGG